MAIRPEASSAIFSASLFARGGKPAKAHSKSRKSLFSQTAQKRYTRKLYKSRQQNKLIRDRFRNSSAEKPMKLACLLADEIEATVCSAAQGLGRGSSPNRKSGQHLEIGCLAIQEALPISCSTHSCGSLPRHLCAAGDRGGACMCGNGINDSLNQPSIAFSHPNKQPMPQEILGTTLACQPFPCLQG